MNPTDAAAMSTLCRLARRWHFDRDDQVVAFVAGAITARPVPPELLVEALDRAGLDWRAALERLAPAPTPRHRIGSRWLRRVIGGAPP